MRVYTTIIFALSIVMGSILPFVTSLSYGEVVLVLILLVAFIIVLASPATNKPSGIFLIMFCLLSGLAMGALRGVFIETKNISRLSQYFGQEVVVVGKVSQYPDIREGYTYLTIGNITLASSTAGLQESILIKANLYPEYKYGDKLEVSGLLAEPQNTISSKDDSLSRFSYKKFLSKDDIYSVIYRPQIKLVEPASSSFVGQLYNFKDKCIALTKLYIAEPASGLLSGILFGTKKALGSETLQIFTAAGLVHIVVLSGYNVALVISAMLRATKRIPRKLGLIMVYAALALFVVFVGASSSVLRAVIMAAIALLAKQFGKQGYAITILFFAAAVLSLYDPRDTLYDPGFALSFLATLGLILWTPIVYGWLGRVPERFLLREITATSISAWLITAPYILWYMGKVSVVALAANIIVLPFVPLVMLLGGLLVLVGLVYPPASLPLAIPLTFVLVCIISVATWLAAWPYSVYVMSLPTFLMVILYSLQFYLVVRLAPTEKSSGYFL